MGCRVGGGFWRRGAEIPCGVNWEERIIEIREGSWSYVAGSIGKAPGMLLTLFLCFSHSKFIFKHLIIGFYAMWNLI